MTYPRHSITYKLDITGSNSVFTFRSANILCCSAFQPVKRKGTKSPKLKGQGRKSGKSKSPSGKKGGKKGKKSASTEKIEKPPVDMLSPVAMENLYFIAHGAPEALVLRGFGWENAPKKKGKKGKKKK